MKIKPGTEGAPLTINERVALGRATGTTADGAIVPLAAGTSFKEIPLPAALDGRQAADVTRLLRAGHRLSHHLYHASDGAEIMAVCRFDKDDDKTFRPLHYAGKAADGRSRFVLGALSGLRPLYNAHVLASRHADPVLFVEGEKAADAAMRLFPLYVVTTTPGGAASVAKADVRDVAGRRCVLMPDNDKAGRDGMDRLASRLLAQGCTVSLVDLPEGYPPKWDLADPVPEGLPESEQPAPLIANARLITGADLPPIAWERSTSPSASANTPSDTKREMYRFFHCARFLATVGRRNFAPSGGYPDWITLRFAAKNTFGDEAFEPFAELSREYGGTDTDEKMRREWDAQELKPAGEGITVATFFKEAIEAGWQDPTRDDAEGEGGKPVRSDPASVVLEQSAAAEDVLWTDQHGKAHVSMVVEGPDGAQRTVHARIGGKRHKGVASQRYRAANPTKVLSGEQEKRAMQLLEHAAREDGAVHDSANRAAMHDGYIYVDLGRADGKAVRVALEGWAVVEQVPVRFVRGSRGALPLPERGGTLADFQRHLNLAAADVVRAVAFVIGALAPLPSFPILLIEGRQGTAKSTIGDMLLALCDPAHSAKGARLTMPRGEENLLVHASGVRVVYVDNVSDITDVEADALCRLSTGGGVTKRQLYENEEETQLNGTRPLVMTCIGTPTSRADLLDRIIRVTARPVTHRRTEESVHSAFVADRARMFGFVLDCLAAALRNKPALVAAADAGTLKLVRMADFAIYPEGAAEVLGLEVGAFSAALLDEQASMQAEGALGDPLGEAVVKWLSADGGSRKVLEGHATEVLDTLRGSRVDQKDLPASNKLKGALRRIELGLADLGVTVTVREPQMGTRNRKTWYRMEAGAGFQRIGEKEEPF